MFHAKGCKTGIKTTSLPTEIWIMILEIVVEEGIVQLDHCDHITFPHMWTSTPASVRRYQFYGSYWRLRLVCRRFNTLLGARPWQSFSDSSLLPLSITTRALYLDLEALSKPYFQPLLTETLKCDRLVYIDVECRLSSRSDRLNLSDFLSMGRTFRSTQRLTLRLVSGPFVQQEIAFWTRLNRAFPLLTTLVIVTNYWGATGEPRLEDDEVICLERLEILYFSCAVSYSGCHFPRLRHASIWKCTRPELEILTRSPHLESLIIRAYISDLGNIDVSSCFRLKLLGFPDHSSLAPLGCDHPVEHIWLYSNTYLRNPDLFEQFLRLPMLSQITVEFSSYDLHYRWRRTGELRRIKFGLSTRPPEHGDVVLVFKREQLDARVTGSVMRKAWSKMRG
jgi:hypothetical protein